MKANTNMATKKQKQELIDVLKFTPSTCRIELGNYGGEVYAGSVDRKVYEYFKSRKIDLDDYANDWDNELEVPAEFQPFPPGSPYDCDNLVHASGATMDSSNLVQVFDKKGNTVWECALDINALNNKGVECSEWESFNSEEVAIGDVVYWGAQGDKGLCFGGDFDITSPFDPNKLKLSYSDADGWLICSGVSYDDQDVDNDYLSTTGKWGENKWILNGEEAYEGISQDDRDEEDEELEWTKAEITPALQDHFQQALGNTPTPACTSEEWDPVVELDKIIDEFNEVVTTDWFPASVKPVRIGQYETHINIKPVWPWPAETMLQWTGKNWKDADGNVVKDVVEWRGLANPVEYITLED